ncbi:hypothetical protein PA0117 [Candidatus Phytoplasma australiense]|uniref:Uncharacterized protein n=2 Tax=Phytoplasma australiense TaxID=59748 RepID=B1V920_PHYAS|nr:Hypothetical Protein SLY_0835 [Strawberry lethal yellows phytoplasma (CPA) str. NZSb11]CAM11452.1 hypothetical protein PA0117 [Candidatus Phytoplasma australiense]
MVCQEIRNQNLSQQRKNNYPLKTIVYDSLFCYTSKKLFNNTFNNSFF